MCFGGGQTVIRDKLFDAYLFGSMAIGCAIAAPWVLYYIVKDEINARM